ncbi:MAG: hypothetical protein NTY98_30150 [Verrucomicrobia bacterium]|nr:hypothetical protein [Verrucomicrobiota bacterium]
MRSVRLLVLSFLIAPLALADTRVFVSLAGTLLEAEITAVSGDNVTLKRSSDQQTLTINRKTLCKEDSTYIATWVAQHPDQATGPAPISNQEVNRDLQNARGLALILAKNTSDRNGDLIVLQKEEFDISIRPQSKMVHTTQPVRLTYFVGGDSPDDGVKSYGYVLIIRDAAGNVLHVEASPDTSAKFTKEILALPDAPCMVDREFKLKSKTDVPLSYISF